jgi:hypothetical protein
VKPVELSGTKEGISERKVTNSKNKNIKDVYRGLNEFKQG